MRSIAIIRKPTVASADNPWFSIAVPNPSNPSHATWTALTTQFKSMQTKLTIRRTGERSMPDDIAHFLCGSGGWWWRRASIPDPPAYRAGALAWLSYASGRLVYRSRRDSRIERLGRLATRHRRLGDRA